MSMNAASLDLLCQQLENYEQSFAALFPREFCLARYQDFLFEAGVESYKRTPEEDWEFGVAADFHDSIGEYETGELIRLCCSDWNFEPPTQELRELAETIRAGSFRFWRSMLHRYGDQIKAAVESVFAQYQQ